jgi:hypothetical protein
MGVAARHAMTDYTANAADLRALRGEMLLAAEGCELPASVALLLRKAAAGLGAVDQCCEPWVLAAVDAVEG